MYNKCAHSYHWLQLNSLLVKINGCRTIQHFLWEVLWDLIHVKMVVFIQATEKVAGQLAAAFIVAAVDTWQIKHSILLTGGSLEHAISTCLFRVKIRLHEWKSTLSTGDID